jgi:ribonuclease HII|tara:strand:+ start:99 stop:785 length:687 start_codon:yes stop_codon:yes gene_type:complete
MPKRLVVPLKKWFGDDSSIEIGIDEVGRGPMLGRVYSAAVILPKDDIFDHSEMKDSKRFSSEKKITEVAEYIKEHAIAWGVGYVDEGVIDEINIRQATFRAMHMAIRECFHSLSEKDTDTISFHLLVDGSDFKPYTVMKGEYGLMQIPHTTIVGGDNKYTSIAAASILAKVSRDEYINKLCEENPILNERYGILKNKGYGTATHMAGIKEHGITKYHRKSFGICKQFS